MPIFDVTFSMHNKRESVIQGTISLCAKSQKIVDLFPAIYAYVKSVQGAGFVVQEWDTIMLYRVYEHPTEDTEA